ncbi:MAG: ABC transporter ATP-binding protein [Thermodesulfobacteriota bacterium]
MPLIVAENLTKIYLSGEVEVRALDGINLVVEPGEFLAVTGRSGSGKSTLMNILGCLDVPSAGTYYLDDEDVSRLGRDRRADLRNRKIGFVFQGFNLLPRINALANVELPLIYGRMNASQRREKAQEALRLVGLEERSHHWPSQLSGGQQQRCAIARALVNSPELILADEPTGNLDTRTSEEIMGVFRELNAAQGITFVLVTHDPELAQHTRRQIVVSDGKIVSDEITGERP